MFFNVSRFHPTLTFESRKGLHLGRVADTDKLSNLLQYRINDGRKKFYSTGPGVVNAIRFLLA